MTKSKILIVEDEGIVAEGLHDKLENLGYIPVGIASSGKDAIQKAEETNPDLVLMDIMIDGPMDGIETAQQILSRFETPVVYLTALSDQSTLERAKITEPFGYIIKPFKDRELHSTVEIALHKHRLEMQLKESEQWLSTLLRSIGDAVISLDVHGYITFLSPVAEKLTGWKQDEILGKVVSEIVHMQDSGNASFIEDIVAEALQGETIQCSVDQEPVLLAKDGKRIPVDIGIAPILGDPDEKNNKVTGAVLVIRDVSPRKQAEQELYEAQQMLSNLLTPREKEILQLLVDGLSTKEIAYDLKISARTVEAHRHNMMQKLNTHDIAMLIRCAITHKLVEVR